MRFLRLKIDNAFVIDKAEIELDKQGLVLVTGESEDGGSNGSGKSSLCTKALIWGLFGRTPDGEKGDDVINKNTGRTSTTVEVHFEEQTDHLKVVRTRNPNTLRFFILDNEGWQDVSNRLEHETQKAIEATIGRSFASFVQTDFFGQGKGAVPFPLLSPKDQRDILENILPIHMLEMWRSHAETSRKELEKEITTTDNGIIINEKVMEGTKQTIDSLENSEKNWNINQQSKILNLKKIIEQMDAKDVELKEQKSHVESMLNSLGPDEDCQSLQEKAETLGNEKDELRSQIKNLETKEFSFQKDIAVIEAKLREISDKCPTL